MISRKKLAQLAVKQSWREAKANAFTLLFFALLVAVASSSTVSYFSERLHQAMTHKASELLGADLVVSGSYEATQEQLEVAKALGLTGTQTVEFSTMLISAEGMELAHIKAATEAYPLLGTLTARTQLQEQDEDLLTGFPRPGEIWLEAALFNKLGLQPGDTLSIGESTLVASHVLTQDPAQNSGIGAFQPRAIMHSQDLAATNIIQPGSRIQYRQLWLGDNEAIKRYQTLLEPMLVPQQSIQTLENNSPPLFQALQRAQQYLSLVSLVAVLLASVGIALTATHFANQRHHYAALLRCFGLSRQQTLNIFVLQLLLVGAVASTAGVALGWFTQQFLFVLLADFLPNNIPPASLGTIVTTWLTGMIMLLGFALPPLITLGRVPPMRVLRAELKPMPSSAWFVYGLALVTLAFIMWRLSLSWSLTALFLLGGFGTALLLGVVLYVVLQRINQALSQRQLSWRLGLGHLLQTPILAISQILAFTLILLAMSLITLLRSELLDNWQQQLPAQAPNHFAFNIMPHEKEGFAKQLAQISPNIATYYPMTPGRLTHINATPILEALPPNSAAERSIQRDLNLTWAAHLPADNRLTKGVWWPPRNGAAVPISVEEDFAQRLGLTLGDEVRFNIAGRMYATEVSSFRKVNWNNMQPNFFVVFAPDYLPNLPFTWLTSFYLPPEQHHELRSLYEAYPSVSILNVNTVITQLRSILAQVSLAIESLLIFVLAAGIMVLLASVQSTLNARIHQGAVLRALGTSRAFIRRLNLYEFATLGATSGLLAWFGAEITSFVLYRFVFDLNWHPHWWLATLPLIGALLISSVGLIGTRRVGTTSPMQILREAD
ncbi:MAG TPA: FtsX-like permease family protein [Alcanivoracaceae bacterium]|nr:FtsX-like permease family protein [Alcanivoracaceae bacterium]